MEKIEEYFRWQFGETAFSLVETDFTKIYCALVLTVCLANLVQMGLKIVENLNDCNYITRQFLGLVPSPA